MNNDMRQVLMNELGLTRESVRQEVVEIVGSVCRAYLDNLMRSGYLDNIIRAEINSLATGKRSGIWRSDETEIQAIVKSVATEQLRDFLKQHLHITYVP